MKELFKVLNELKAKHIITNYAIGGGIAALAYIEPVLTYDVDVFVILRTKKSSLILLSPIYDYLRVLGYNQWVGGHIIVGDQKVQFIVGDGLGTEAITNAKVKIYKGTTVRIVSPEYLVALFLVAGRQKDKYKARMILDQAKIDKNKLLMILRKYRLISKYKLL